MALKWSRSIDARRAVVRFLLRFREDEPMKMMAWSLAASVLLCASAAMAARGGADGVVEFNQADALKGGVTPGDAPGFPVTLSAAGSYRLTGNLTVPAGGSGVQIDADNVTLDLNGFSIIGANSCNGDSRTTTTSCTDTATFDGVSSTKGQITIRNGTIRGMRFGIFLQRGPALVEEVHATQNSFGGIAVESGVLRRNTASNNGGNGISTQGSNGDTANGASVLTDNVAIGNANNGLVASGGKVTGNTSYRNRVGRVTWDSTVLENTIRANGVAGLIVFRSLYGSNLIVNNAGAPVVFPDSTSQNNNNCDGATC